MEHQLKGKYSYLVAASTCSIGVILLMVDIPIILKLINKLHSGVQAPKQDMLMYISYGTQGCNGKAIQVCILALCNIHIYEIRDLWSCMKFGSSKIYERCLILARFFFFYHHEPNC